MFSKALFRQSCRANGTMWAVITVALSFMLACVMLISGSGTIGEAKDSIQDTIIVKEIDSSLEKMQLANYKLARADLALFDAAFAPAARDTLSLLTFYANMPKESDFGGSTVAYEAALRLWQSRKPAMTTAAGRAYDAAVADHLSAMPKAEDYSDSAAYLTALGTWQEASPLTKEKAVAAAYGTALSETVRNLSKDGTLFPADATDAMKTEEGKKRLAPLLASLNPDGMFNGLFSEHEKKLPDDYDVTSICAYIAAGHTQDTELLSYVNSEDRAEYRQARAEEMTAMLLSANMTLPESVDALLEALSSYGVDREKYDSFHYDYDSIKHLARTAVITYSNRYDYELGLLNEKKEAGGFADDAAYEAAVADMEASLTGEIAGSFLSTLPQTVSDALEEVGKADLYTLIVGSIFYKLAGLLLPIIYMIMASNNLIAGQVDSGSMAYVLSTSTKRVTVAFTQGVYLVGSLFAMFAVTTATGCVCLAIVKDRVMLTFGKLILLNVGAFLVLFALSGLCFFTSCFFDRSKHSMAIGGGLSIFALVAAMLGLFGSPVIPSVVRLDALNSFNYTTIISLFDVISIMDGTGVFLWKFAVLIVLALIGYICGTLRFIKKDLPL